MHDKEMTLEECEKIIDAGNERSEIFIGLVGAIGTDLALVVDWLSQAFKKVNYASHVIKLSDFLDISKVEPSSNPFFTVPGCWGKISNDKMTAGNDFRKLCKRGDALIFPSISRIWEIRREVYLESGNTLSDADENEAAPVLQQTVFIFSSLKHLKEVESLRKVYGKSFYLVGAYADRETRIQYVSQKIAQSQYLPLDSQFRGMAEILLERDLSDAGMPLGQNVQKTFPEADIFLNMEEPGEAKKAIRRFVDLLFGNAFHTPTRNEYAMFHARAAALRSGDLGRQVGAVITLGDGDIVSIGTNEVPKVGGGQYWTGDKPDKRDYQVGYDWNDRMKRNLLRDIMRQLDADDWLNSGKGEQIDSFVDSVFAKDAKSDVSVKSAQLMNLIAYFRAVHAEMAAIISAARRGVAIADGTIVCTTFPCHECARHIVAAGIKEVIYIEPYPKSLTPQLYLDSISIDRHTSDKETVRFSPFVGIAPRQYGRLFDASKVKRKESDGNVKVWDPQTSIPRNIEPVLAYRERETLFINYLRLGIEQGIFKGLDQGVLHEQE